MTTDERTAIITAASGLLRRGVNLVRPLTGGQHARNSDLPIIVTSVVPAGRLKAARLHESSQHRWPQRWRAATGSTAS